MNDVVPPELLRRQYLQMMNPDRLALLSTDLLCPQRQSDIYESMFNESNLIYPPPERYRFRVLKKIVTVLEAAIEDPEEDVGFPFGSIFLGSIARLVMLVDFSQF